MSNKEVSKKQLVERAKPESVEPALIQNGNTPKPFSVSGVSIQQSDNRA